MKKERSPEKLPILLDTNNPWQVVLIVLITLVVTAAIRFGMELLKVSGAFSNEQPKYTSSQNLNSSYYYYYASLMNKNEKDSAKKEDPDSQKRYGVTKIETVKNEKGIYVPKPTEEPEALGNLAESGKYGY